MVKVDKAQELDEQIARLSKAAKLDSWNSYVETLQVPGDLLPALMSGRPELLKLVPARPLNEAEVKLLLQLIAGLMETNMALREHAEQLAQFTHNWADAFKHLHSLGNRIERFAHFDHNPIENDDG